MGKTTLRSWLWLALALGALAVAGCRTAYTFHGTAMDPIKAAPDFTLTDTRGQQFHLAAQQGKVLLLYFGYTHCPDVCPLTLANLAQARRALGAEASNVQVLFVTTDPERDTADVMRSYLERFDPSFVGLLGSWSDISPILEKYYASAARHDPSGSAPDYTVDHTAYIYAIDRGGRWRVLYSPDAKIEDLANDLRFLIHEGL